MDEWRVGWDVMGWAGWGWGGMGWDGAGWGGMGWDGVGWGGMGWDGMEWHFAYQRSHFTLPSHCTLHTPHFTLHTSQFALHTSSHLISSELRSPHLSSSYLISFLFRCHLGSSHFFISSEHCSTFLISPKLFFTHLSSCVRQNAFSVREKLFYKALEQRSFWTQMLLHRKAFTHTHKILHTESFCAWEP